MHWYLYLFVISKVSHVSLSGINCYISLLTVLVNDDGITKRRRRECALFARCNEISIKKIACYFNSNEWFQMFAHRFYFKQVFSLEKCKCISFVAVLTSSNTCEYSCFRSKCIECIWYQHCVQSVRIFNCQTDRIVRADECVQRFHSINIQIWAV